MVGIGGLLAATGITGFFIPRGIFEGGATGLSILGASTTTISLPLFLLIVNTPFLILGWNRFGSKFIIKCILTIIYFAVFVMILKVPVLTNDKILCAVFGGILLGAGTGFAINGGSVLDGTEIAAIIICEKVGLSIGSIILIFNVVIFGLVAFFKGYEVALYSILTYMLAAKSANFLIHGLEEYIGISIVSINSEKIRKALTAELKLGVTVYSGKTGFEGKHQEILFCVVTKYDIQRVKRIASSIDEKAFIVTQPVDNVHGGLVKTKMRKKRF